METEIGSRIHSLVMMEMSEHRASSTEHFTLLVSLEILHTRYLPVDEALTRIDQRVPVLVLLGVRALGI